MDFKKYDAVVIDEAQDLLTIDYLLAIDQILIGGLEGKLGNLFRILSSHQFLMS